MSDSYGQTQLAGGTFNSVASTPITPADALTSDLPTGGSRALGLRNVSYNTLCSRVPEPHERARFMSIQSAVQHFASASGAFLSARLLSERADHALIGMDLLGRISIGLSLAVPVLIYLVERAVRARDRLRVTAAALDLPGAVESG